MTSRQPCWKESILLRVGAWSTLVMADPRASTCAQLSAQPPALYSTGGRWERNASSASSRISRIGLSKSVSSTQLSMRWAPAMMMPIICSLVEVWSSSPNVGVLVWPSRSLAPASVMVRPSPAHVALDEVGLLHAKESSTECVELKRCVCGLFDQAREDRRRVTSFVGDGSTAF